jgi:toxin ParE1/3/4
MRGAALSSPIARRPRSGLATVSGENPLPRAIADAIDDVGENPQASPRSSDPEIRVKILGRYRYKIFYSVAADGYVEIIHLRHGSRRPWV